jgi:hypothetical protein
MILNEIKNTSEEDKFQKLRDELHAVCLSYEGKKELSDISQQDKDNLSLLFISTKHGSDAFADIYTNESFYVKNILLLNFGGEATNTEAKDELLELAKKCAWDCIEHGLYCNDIWTECQEEILAQLEDEKNNPEKYDFGDPDMGSN